ncbi:MAG: hypothetical protein HC911_18070 [Chloroflexaceae bacterium]|nr:hypothetical protein [Chloroflexaceae bacterium]
MKRKQTAGQPLPTYQEVAEEREAAPARAAAARSGGVDAVSARSVTIVQPRVPRIIGGGLLDKLLGSAAMLAMLYLMFEVWRFGAMASLAAIGSFIPLAPLGQWVMGHTPCDHVS